MVREERRAREEAVARVRRQGQAADGGDEGVALQGAVEVQQSRVQARVAGAGEQPHEERPTHRVSDVRA